MSFIKDKTNLEIKTNGLPDLKTGKEEIFEFSIVKKGNIFELSIPGTPRGYDLVIPSSKEQESWLREVEKSFEEGFKEIWYCLWQINNENILSDFLKIIKPNIIKEEYL